MGSRAKRTDPDLWERVKSEVTAGGEGGNPGQWSARKAQMAVQAYKRRGGGYEGPKRTDNSLRRWTEEEWGTRSGRKSGETGERYLPKAAREALSDDQHRRTTAKKRADAREGRQFSRQPPDVAREAARSRRHEPTRAELYERAKRRDLPGRSRMSKDELREALR
jgi:hypothetical protein